MKKSKKSGIAIDRSTTGSRSAFDRADTVVLVVNGHAEVLKDRTGQFRNPPRASLPPPRASQEKRDAAMKALLREIDVFAKKIDALSKLQPTTKDMKTLMGAVINRVSKL